VDCYTTSHHLPGPEETTLFERLVEHVRVPYPIACLLLALVPGYASSNFGESTLDWILWTILAFYMFYVIRYMRLKVVRAESELLPLCPNGEETFHKAFGRVAQRKSQVLLWLLVGSISILYFFRLFRFTGGVYLSLTVATISLFAVAWGTVFWVYFSSIYGLHVLGQEPLNLKDFREDATLGVRPLGYLSLHLAFVYLSVIALGALATSFFPDLFTTASLLAFVIIGGALFFLPLRSMHRTMQKQRVREHSSIRSQFRELVASSKDLGSSEKSLSDLHGLLADLKGLMALEIVERKALAIPTWPFDGVILGQLALVMLSVIAAIIAQIIVVALRL